MTVFYYFLLLSESFLIITFCRKNIDLSLWTVVLGLHDQYNSNTADRQNHKIDLIIMNQNYNRRTKDSDIALIHLQDKVTFTGND